MTASIGANAVKLGLALSTAANLSGDTSSLRSTQASKQSSTGPRRHHHHHAPKTRRPRLPKLGLRYLALPLRPVPGLSAHPRQAISRLHPGLGRRHQRRRRHRSTKSTPSTICSPATSFSSSTKRLKQQKYKTAADSIRKTFDTYPRTKDGGLWHAYSRQHQLWLDGMFMSMPFLVRYGAAFNDSQYACDEAVRQFLIYASHLNDPVTGLMFHAYDESGDSPGPPVPATTPPSSGAAPSAGTAWPSSKSSRSCPTTIPNAPISSPVRQLATAYEKYQDPATGLWYQDRRQGAPPPATGSKPPAPPCTPTPCPAPWSAATSASDIADHHQKGLRRSPHATIPRPDGFAHIAEHLRRHQRRRPRLLPGPPPQHRRLPRPRRLPHHERTTPQEKCLKPFHSPPLFVVPERLFRLSFPSTSFVCHSERSEESPHFAFAFAVVRSPLPLLLPALLFVIP